MLAHHTRLNAGANFEPIELEHLAYAGIQEFARQWLLIGRRERFEPGSGIHRLWLTAGGSMGQSGQWALDIDEGVLADDFTGRKWDVQVTTMGESRQTQADKCAEEKRLAEAAKDRDDEAKLLGALDGIDPDKQGVSFTRLRDASGIEKRAGKTVERLIKDGFLIDIPEFKTPTGRPARGVKRPTSGTSGR